MVTAVYLLGITSPAAYVWFAFAGAAATTVLVWLVAPAGRGGPTPPVAEAYVLPVLAEARLPLAGIDGTGVHRHAGGWFDAVALPGDPAADAAGAQVLADRHELLEVTAERLTGVAPLFQAIAASMPVGPAALLGGLADSIGGAASGSRG